MKFQSVEHELAVHEAGHFFCTVRELGIVSYMTAIFPERYCGICFLGERESYAENEMVGLMAGYAAWSVFTHEGYRENQLKEFIDMADGDYRLALEDLRRFSGKPQITEDMLYMMLSCFNSAQLIVMANISSVMDVAAEILHHQFIAEPRAAEIVRIWQGHGVIDADAQIAIQSRSLSSEKMERDCREEINLLFAGNPLLTTVEQKRLCGSYMPIRK